MKILYIEQQNRYTKMSYTDISNRQAVKYPYLCANHMPLSGIRFLTFADFEAFAVLFNRDVALEEK